MKRVAIFAFLAVYVFSLFAFPGRPFAAQGKTERFCTMETAVQRLLDAAGIPEDLQREDVVWLMAEDIVGRKLARRPGQRVKMEWKDVYDMRGSVNAYLAQNGHPFNRIGQAIDAVGSALTGTILGKIIMMNGLMLAGPAGFIMLGGMNVVQETFQCNPSGVVMALNAGATIIVLIPWCRVPGVSRGCVALTNGVEKGVQKAATSIFGKQVSATFVKETANGIVAALRFKSKDKVITAVEILNYLDGRRHLRKARFKIGASSTFENRNVNWDGLK